LRANRLSLINYVKYACNPNSTQGANIRHTAAHEDGPIVFTDVENTRSHRRRQILAARSGLDMAPLAYVRAGRFGPWPPIGAEAVTGGYALPGSVAELELGNPRLRDAAVVRDETLSRFGGIRAGYMVHRDDKGSVARFAIDKLAPNVGHLGRRDFALGV